MHLHVHLHTCMSACVTTAACSGFGTHWRGVVMGGSRRAVGCRNANISLDGHRLGLDATGLLQFNHSCIQQEGDLTHIHNTHTTHTHHMLHTYTHNTTHTTHTHIHTQHHTHNTYTHTHTTPHTQHIYTFTQHTHNIHTHTHTHRGHHKPTCR